MKFSALALDFDGTIAHNDTLDPEVRKAIAELRARGIVVILVTGRILSDLRRVAGDLHFVDAVVAENGAAIEFPDSGYSTALGPSPPPPLLAELQRQEIPFAAGQSIVEAAARDAPAILTILQRLELPLVLAFNRGRVMLLPQAISKATGLREALTILRLSEHNTVGIGDAENDHELLRACETGVAVAWGSEALKASADYVLPGDGPPAVAGYIRQLAAAGQLPAELRSRRRLTLGHTMDGLPFVLAARGRNILVAGDPKSGKSWVTGLLCEQLILYGYSLCIIDPEGDYTSLEALPGVAILGGADPLPRVRDLLRAFRHADASIVIDLSRTPHQEKLEYMGNLLPALATLRQHTGLPHQIVVDEAHYFLHGPSARDLLDLESRGYLLVTYRASKLHPDLLAAAQAVVVTRESDPHEVDSLFSLCRSCAGRIDGAEWRVMLGNLLIGEAVALPMTDEAEGIVRRIRLSPRLTPHVRHMAKYVDIPIPEAKAFVFWVDGSLSGRRARTLREFVATMEELPVSSLGGHMRRHDFSNWVAGVLGDLPLAKDIAQCEDEYRAGKTHDAGTAIVEAIRSRYEFIEPELAPPGP